MFSCGIKKTEYSKDFSFKIIETTSEYNSKTGIYTRQYIEKDSSLNVRLDDNELKQIQELVLDLEFKNFPEEFECSKNYPSVMLPFKTTIEISTNGKLKKTTNRSTCKIIEIQQKMSKDFDKIASEINQILESKKEIINMRPCDKVFL